MASTTTRDEKVIVKLAPEIKAKLQAHCEDLGVSMSGFLAVTIGQILKQSELAEMAMKNVFQQMGEQGIMAGMKMAADQVESEELKQLEFRKGFNRL